MISNYVFPSIASLLAVSGITTTLAIFNDLRALDVNYSLERIIVDNSGPITTVSNIRIANVPALPIVWSMLLRDYQNDSVICAKTGTATVTKTPGNIYGPFPLETFMGNAGCKQADGKIVILDITIKWNDNGRPEWQTVISDPFTARMKPNTGD